jgi:putative transposase
VEQGVSKSNFTILICRGTEALGLIDNNGVETRHCRVSNLNSQMTLFGEQYRIESAHKSNWDYTLPGCYFVTVCTRERKPHFGRVVNATMNLSPIGECAHACWKEVPQHHQHIDIDDFVVMPNHIHGIVIIGGPERLPELRKREKFKQIAELNTVRPKANSLGAVVGSFKSGYTVVHGTALGVRVAAAVS